MTRHNSSRRSMSFQARSNRKARSFFIRSVALLRIMVEQKPTGGTAMSTSSPKPDQPRVSASGDDLTPPSPSERERMAAALSPEERRVILHQGTEPPF